MLSAVTDDACSQELRFIHLHEIEDRSDSVSMSMSMTSGSTALPSTSNADTESARRKASQRVQDYKKLQRHLKRLSTRSIEQLNDEENVELEVEEQISCQNEALQVMTEHA